MDTPEPRLEDVPADAPWLVRWLVPVIVPALVVSWRNAYAVWARFWPILAGAACELYAEDQAQIQQYVLSNIPESWKPHILAIGFAVALLVREIKLRKGNAP